MNNSRIKRDVEPILPVLKLSDFPNAVRAASEKMPAEFDLKFKSDHAIQVDPRWEDVLSKVIGFKVAVDHIVEGGVGKFFSVDFQYTLDRYGVEWKRLRRVADDRCWRGLTNTWPEHFLRSFIFGDFAVEDDLTLKAVGWMPPWTRVGRLYDHVTMRRAGANLSRIEVEGTVAAMEKECLLDSNASAGWLFGGIPLVQAGENKNRYHFYWKYGLNQLVRLRVYSYPEPEHLRLQRVPFDDRMAALHLLDTRGRTIETALLPIGDLAAPVLESYGVTWLHGVWYGYFSPLSVVIAEGKSVPWFQRLRPKRLWRKLVYGQ